MSAIADYGRMLARREPALTDEQVESAARILASVGLEEAA